MAKPRSIIQRVLGRMGYVPAPGSRIKSLRVQADRDNEWTRSEGVPRPERIEDGGYAYSVSSWVFSCVDAIATTLAGIPIFVMRRTPDGSEEVEHDHPLYQLLRSISPISDSYTTLEATSAYFDLAGNCYWDISQKVENRPEAVYMLEPERMKVLPDSRNFVGGYIYTVNGKKFRFEPDEIIHFKTFNPNSFYYGQSRLSAARLAATVDFHAQAFNKAFFKNGCAPEGVLETEQNLGDEQFNRIKMQWEQRYQGAAKAHKTLILEGGLEYKPLSVAPKDMQFILQRKMSREEITAVFRVPPAIVGIYEYANYANAEVQEKAFYQRTVLPRLRRILSKLNRELCPYYGEDIYLEEDVSGIEVLQDDEDKQAQIDERLVRSGILTVNEIRAQRGYEPVPWGEEPPAQNVGPILASLPGDNTQRKALPAPGSKAATREDHYSAERVMGGIYRPLKKLYGDLADEIVRWLKSDGRMSKLRAYAEATEPEDGKRDKNRDRAIVAALFSNFDWHRQQDKRIEADLADPYKNVFERGARFGAKKVRAMAARRQPGKMIPWAGGKKAFELVNEDILAQLKARRDFWIAGGMEDVVDSLLETIRKEYFDKWQQYDDDKLLSTVQRLMGYETQWQAQRTAKTETHHVGQNAIREMYNRAQVRIYRWRHSGNPNGRENHMELDDTAINVAEGELFQVGRYQAQGPADPALGPEESINCDCDTDPDVLDDSGEYTLPDELWSGS